MRLAVNRDERRSRSLAWAPRLAWREDVPVVWPIDSDSLGTWVAATGTGIVWALVNLNRGGTLMPRAPRTSRGHVIPALVGASGLIDARRRCERLDLQQFAPFRLLAVTSDELAFCVWDGQRIETAQTLLRTPQILSSSSLGDHVVDLPRAELFDCLLARHVDQWRAQDHLHQHAWPDRRHLSVLMSRPTARTVSRTVVLMSANTATMSYAPVVDGWIGPAVTIELERITSQIAVCA